MQHHRYTAARLALGLALLLAAGGCGDAGAPLPDADAVAGDVAADADAAPEVSAPTTLRVLFIGNSFTSVSDTPATLAALADDERSPVRFETARYTVDGQTLEGHAGDSTALARIAEGWDFVVLQDQSGQPMIWDGVKPAIATLDSAIRAAGARTALFMTWSLLLDPSSMFSMNMAVDRYYERQGQAVGALVAPVGRAWERALRQPGIVLHGPDATHPEVTGAYLAACVFYATLSGQSPVGLGDAGVAIDPEVARRLRAIAWDTVVARQPPTPPLLGAWPLAADGAGNDVLPGPTLALGDAEGPTRAPAGATTFDIGKFAAIPYFVGLDAPHLTVAVDAYRADWAAATAVPQFLVGKYHGFYLRQSGATLSAGLATVDQASPDPIDADTSLLAPGWHHLALTYDGARAALWIDGAEVAHAALSGALAYSAGASGYDFNGVALGAPPVSEVASVAAFDSPSAFVGRLANLRLYAEALDADAIARLATGSQQR